MTNLKVMSSIYNQYKMRPPKYTQYTVEDGLFKRLNKILLELRSSLGSDLLHQNISLIDYEIRNLLYMFSTTFSPFAHFISEEYFNPLMDRFKNDFSAFPVSPSDLEAVTQSLKVIFDSPQHPYELALKEIISYTSMKYTIITKKPLHPETLEKLTKMYNEFSVEFKTYIEFSKNIKVYDNVIFIGSPKVYSSNILQYVNANHFYFVLFGCYYSPLDFDQWIEHERIVGSHHTPVVNRMQLEHTYNVQTIAPTLDDIDTAELIFEEPTLPETLISVLISDEYTQINEATVECKLIELEGNAFLFEEIGKKAKCDVVTMGFLFERKHLNDIITGEFFVLIDFYSWDDRKAVADRHFEKEGILVDRAKLDNLKKFLNNKIEKYGVERYTKMLNKKANLNLKPYQILGLTKKESFKLQNDYAFFALLKSILKTENTAHIYFNAAKKLASYHNQLGRIVRNQLRAYLDANPSIFENIDKFSEIQIPNMNFLRVELCKIKRISENTYQVPTSRVGIPILISNKEAI